MGQKQDIEKWGEYMFFYMFVMICENSTASDKNAHPVILKQLHMKILTPQKEKYTQ